MTQLSGIRVLVTGGTSGLGNAMAKALAEAGARVAVTTRLTERASATAVELGGERSGMDDGGSTSISITELGPSCTRCPSEFPGL
jgi:NAD(P)-dependent dehydrogenase (short-subunit alcohol dehydrogenase family)